MGSVLLRAADHNATLAALARLGRNPRFKRLACFFTAGGFNSPCQRLLWGGYNPYDGGNASEPTPKSHTLFEVECGWHWRARILIIQPKNDSTY